MPTLRERVREALSAREPDEREVARDLETILERAKGGKRARPRVGWPVLLAPALVAAALLLFLLFPRPSPVVNVAPVAPPPSGARVVAAKNGVHLYLKLAGEPADRAIALDLDLDSKGEL